MTQSHLTEIVAAGSTLSSRPRLNLPELASGNPEESPVTLFDQ